VTFRAPTLADADWIAQLVIDCDLIEYGEPDYDRDELLGEWSEPGVDLERDGFVTEGAYGLVLHTTARAWVHPGHRGRGIGTALAERLEGRARERGLPHLDQHVATMDTAGRALLEARGYVLRHSYAFLALPADAVAGLPHGGAGPYDPARDEQAMQDLLVRAFADDGGRIDPLEVVLRRNPDLSLWFVADAEDGALAGALRAEMRENDRGYIAAVGTAREHRGRGVASALIGAAARALVERGATTVTLSVRSSNPGALRLYARLGFRGDWDTDELRLTLTGAAPASG
jgi:ribosomal protein S18 acetylase RimI-like enzyme